MAVIAVHTCLVAFIHKMKLVVSVILECFGLGTIYLRLTPKTTRKSLEIALMNQGILVIVYNVCFHAVKFQSLQVQHGKSVRWFLSVFLMAVGTALIFSDFLINTTSTKRNLAVGTFNWVPQNISAYLANATLSNWLLNSRVLVQHNISLLNKPLCKPFFILEHLTIH